MKDARGKKEIELGPGRIPPEIGAPDVHVSREDVAQAFREVGVRTGDVLMVHSSLSSMGTVQGGADAVIDGCLDAGGTGGTLAVPSLWFRPGEDVTRWNKDSSPTFTGSVSERVRHRPDSFRSDDPSHAVAAIGSRARELTATHGESGRRPGTLGDRGFSADSPWEKLYRWDAAYCFIGVNMTVNTLGHYAEYVLVDRALAPLPERARSELADRLSGWFFSPGAWPKYDFKLMGEELESRGFVRRTKLGSATLRCIRSRTSVDETIRIALQDPERWLDPEFVQWLRDAQARHAEIG